MVIVKFIKRVFLLSVLILSISALVNGQENIVFDEISTKDGLSNGTVNVIFHDSKGFMWFGTDDGLCRYDGYNFKIYRAEDTDKSLFKNIQILSLTEDSYGNFWIGTSLGLFFYKQKSDRIVPLHAFDDFEIDNLLSRSLINSLFFDSRQYLWVGTYNGILRIKITNHDVETIKTENIEILNFNSEEIPKQGNNNVISINEDSQSQIWISSNSDKIYYFNYQKNKFTHHKIDLPDLKEGSNLGLKLKIDKNDNFWIASNWNGLIYWERDKNKFTQYKTLSKGNESIDIQSIKTFIIDHNDRIWIGTDGNGLIALDENRKDFQVFEKDINDHSKLSSNAIYSIYEDSTGIFWIGTYLMGLNKYDSEKINFGQYNSSPYSKTGLSHNIITGFCEDKNKQIWISTDGGGVNLFDKEANKFKHYKHDPDNQTSLSTNTTITTFCDNNNDIWIGTFNGGLNRFNQKTQKFNHFWHKQIDSTSLSSNHTWSIEQDKSNNLWVGTVNAGLNLLKPNSTEFVRYVATIEDSYGPSQIHSNSITQLFIDKNNRLWIGTEYGLDMIDLNLVDFSLPKPNLIFNHYMPSDTINSISFDRISCINEDSLNNLWIGTRGGGLNKLELKTNLFTCYTVEDGLPHNIINGILFDNDNNPWISTNNGLSCFNIKTNKFINYSNDDGLQSNLFVKTSFLKTADGMFLFGGVNGFNAFYPENITSKISKFKPNITDLKIFNQSVNVGEKINERVILSKAIYNLDTIFLSYKENSLAFEFSALDFSNPEKIFYSYKLEGFDKEWQVTSAKKREARYTNLAPGEYTLNIKASSNEEKWTDKKTSLKIYLTPPWWKTLLFKILIVILILALWLIGVFARIYRLEKQKLTLKLKVEEKTVKLVEANRMKDKFLSIIAHDLINPFNTILGFSDLLLNSYQKLNEESKIEAIKNINDSSNNLYDLLENLLHWSRSERGLLEFVPEKIDINQYIQKNISLLSTTAKAKEITISNKLLNESIYVKSDIQLLNVILRNLISNAIKFTSQGGKIIVKSERKSNFMLVSIIDNGVGIAKDKIEEIFFRADNKRSTPGTNNEKGTGLGLILVNEFVAKQQGTFNIESKIGEGSTFSFTVPCWKD